MRAGRAGVYPCSGQLAQPFQHVCHPKIRQLEAVIGHQEHVSGLHVPVDDALQGTSVVGGVCQVAWPARQSMYYYLAVNVKQCVHQLREIGMRLVPTSGAGAGCQEGRARGMPLEHMVSFSTRTRGNHACQTGMRCPGAWSNRL